MRLQENIRAVLRTVCLGTLIILMLAGAGASSVAAATFLQQAGQTAVHREELKQVLSVVEHRTTDGRVMDKLRKKVFALDERELRLAASLCERIARDDASAGAKVAFSIVTAMIVLR